MLSTGTVNCQFAYVSHHFSSDPRSENYGKHLTKAQVTDMFAATDKTISSVKNWLVGSGIPAKAITVSKGKTWITVTTTIANLEKALKTEYHYYKSDLVDGDHIGADEYSLPSEVSDAVEYIIPGLSKSRINSRAANGKPANYAIKEPAIPLAQSAVKQLQANICKSKHRLFIRVSNNNPLNFS